MSTKQANRPYAVFDLDGTLIRWQLFHAIVDKFAKSGRLSTAQYQAVKDARKVWKNRTSDKSFDDYQNELIKAYQIIVKDLSTKEFENVARAVFEIHKDQVYVYTRELMRELKTKGYLLFAVSGSFSHIVELVANYYGFDDSAGSIQAVSEGKFTGERDIIQFDRKVDKIKELALKHDATNNGSIAIGDSMGDLAMLEYVEQAIAFNPSRELFEYAVAQGWKVVVERKNTIYQLNKQGDEYVLGA